jgi:hypothetical protein
VANRDVSFSSTGRECKGADGKGPYGQSHDLQAMFWQRSRRKHDALRLKDLSFVCCWIFKFQDCLQRERDWVFVLRSYCSLASWRYPGSRTFGTVYRRISEFSNDFLLALFNFSGLTNEVLISCGSQPTFL